jgi:hypothetical protein
MSIKLVALVSETRHQTGATCHVCSVQFDPTRNIYIAVAARLVQGDLPCWRKYPGNYFKVSHYVHSYTTVQLVIIPTKCTIYN